MVYGGASLGTLHLIEGLDQNRFECKIICGSQSEKEGNILQNAKKEVLSIIIPEMVREIDPIKDFITFLKLIAIIKKNRYDIVHTHGSKAGVIGRLAAAICRVPVIMYTVHGWGLKTGNIFTRALFRWIEKTVASFSTMLLFQTRSDMDEASQYRIGTDKKYYLIGNGINIKPFLNYEKQKAKKIIKELALSNVRVIGTVGRVSAQKNPVGFIEIAQKVLEKKKNIKFIFVGGGELLDDMVSSVNALGLAKRIIFTGVRNDVPEVVANFDIFILPSLWEGMPRSVIEAMVMAKPVIVYNMGGISELIRDNINGVVIPMNQKDKFANSIVTLLNNKHAQKKLGQQARLASKHFNFDNVIIKTQNVYECLVRE